MAFALYRKSNNEVMKWSAIQQFLEADPIYYGVAVDPVTPDGTEVRDRSGAEPGPMRQLGFAKIYVPGTNTMRNATQGEIDGFEVGTQTDRKGQDLELAQGYFDETNRFTSPVIRKILKALVKMIVNEHNTMAARFNALRAEMLAASNLADLKARVTANTQNFPVRTLGQAKTALLRELQPGD